MRCLIFLFSGILLISSCTFHRGMMSGNMYAKTSETDFIQFSIGRSSTVRLLGFGGAKTQGLVFDAKNDLYYNYPLKEGQAYANFTVDIQDFYFLIFSKTTAIVSADIVGPSSSTAGIIGPSNSKLESLGIPVGSSGYVGMPNGLYAIHFVLKQLPNGQLVVKQSGSSKVIVNPGDVFLTSQPFVELPFQRMDKVTFEMDGVVTEGLIIGVQIDRALIKIAGNEVKYCVKEFSEISRI